jgi:hypothetical protein
VEFEEVNVSACGNGASFDSDLAKTAFVAVKAARQPRPAMSEGDVHSYTLPQLTCGDAAVLLE